MRVQREGVLYCNAISPVNRVQGEGTRRGYKEKGCYEVAKRGGVMRVQGEERGCYECLLPKWSPS